jgi:hypothetical protein
LFYLSLLSPLLRASNFVPGERKEGFLLGKKSTAAEVATAAERFGQEDDISVIAVTPHSRRGATLAYTLA